MKGMTDPQEKALFERMVEDAMQSFGFGRTKAESLAKKMIVRFRKLGHFQEPGSPGHARKAPGKKKARSKRAHGPLTREEIARLPPVKPKRPPPRNAKERMERRLGPDDGVRRRGGSPFVQGGSPGLGKRR